MKSAKGIVVLLATAAVVLGIACMTQSQDMPAAGLEHMHKDMWSSVKEGIAVLHPTQGNNAHGWVRFMQDGEAVHIVAHLEGLPPNSVHGFHIHEFGDCSAPDASSAGGHYNPEGHKHAGPETPERHAGDLGNVTADAQGVAQLELTVNNISVAGMLNPIIGRGVIGVAKPAVETMK